MSAFEELYSITELRREGPEGPGAVVRLNPSASIFGAHFPGYPITPGACLLQIALDCISACEGRSFELVSAKEIKFLSPVFPEDGAVLTLSFPVAETSADTEVRRIMVYRGNVLAVKMSLSVRGIC